MTLRKPNRVNWQLYTVWIIIMVATVAITRFYEVQGSSFYGIAETREIIVNCETAVEIKKISVTEGQSVEQGMLLVELSSPDLMLKINHISHQLDQLKAQKGVDKSEILSRLRQLKAEKAAKENELENQIAQLENQYKINKSLLSDLKSIPGGTGYGDDDGSNPMKMRISSLKKELSLCVNPILIQIELLQATLDNSDNPIKIQVERLEKELILLRAENNKLNIYAQISGIIGSVNFKPGEKVSPFAPILTLHTKTPSFIKGYIYENTYSAIAMGDCVNVASLVAANNGMTGCVVGIGARIVAYPVRLRKHPDVQLWGREVVIQIPADNPFILGEKVLITSVEAPTGFVDILKKTFMPSDSVAGVIKPVPARPGQEAIRSIIPLGIKGIEASAILYLEDIDRYMVLSDDTPKNAPVVQLMDFHGRVTGEKSISGLDRINDMESVSQGEKGVLYICSSMSPDHNGRIKASRNRLVSVHRQGDEFTLGGMIDLYAQLKARAEKERGSEWAEFILGGVTSKTLDIEGQFYRDGALFIGFKAPLNNGQSVILKIADIDRAIVTQSLSPRQVSIWKKISLRCGANKPQERISDLFYFKDTLYMTGVPMIKKKGSRSGSLWRLDQPTETAVRLVQFKDLQPEGIATGPDQDTLMICFDQGRKNKSKICVVKVTK